MSQGIACKDAVRFPLKCNVGHGPVQNGLSEKIWRVTVNEYYEYSQRRTRIFIRRAFWSKSDRGAEAPRSGFLDCLGWRLLLDKTRVNTLEGVKLPVITKVVVTKSYMVWESPRLAKNPHIKRGYPGCT